MGVRTRRPWIGAAVLALAAGFPARAHGQAGRLTLALTDPSRPGTVTVQLVHGSIVVRGTDRRDVLIEAVPRGGAGRYRSRLSEPSAAVRAAPLPRTFTASQEDNVISLRGTNPGKPVDFDIEVPSRTNLRLATVNVGDILVESVDGELEVSNVNGSIALTNVAGSVVASSVNGEVQASLTDVASEKAMAFTSLHGTVDITLPSAVRANLRLRSDAGAVFSEFDLQTRSAPSPSAQDARRTGRPPVAVNGFLYGSVNGGGPEFELRSFDGDVYVRRGR